ncbi:hypothetical protein GGX14DRAFT_404388 [Mycena pura]|uniref:Uncharacterized protein n=1 Tax=Mycena pura TaxID=153505 RepID=A0AAD6UYD8_9AGAR|nr:hypothetical protein GGX14DRAFT_404388 [Mycena pura]
MLREPPLAGNVFYTHVYRSLHEPQLLTKLNLVEYPKDASGTVGFNVFYACGGKIRRITDCMVFRRAACWAVACSVMGNNAGFKAGNAFTTYGVDAESRLQNTEGIKILLVTKVFRLMRPKTAKNRLLICPIIIFGIRIGT